MEWQEAERDSGAGPWRERRKCVIRSWTLERQEPEFDAGAGPWSDKRQNVTQRKSAMQTLGFGGTGS